MRPNEIKMTMYRKDEKGKYQYYTEITDERTVINDLLYVLIAKKLEKCTHISKIKREQLYNGFIKITVYTPYNYKYEYIVKDH